MKTFKDRVDAGRQLAENLQRFARQPGTTIVALPRGGVPVAAAIAQDLQLPLDILVVRKLGAPGQAELAMGAIASGGISVMNSGWFASVPEQTQYIDSIIVTAQLELQRRENIYRGMRPPLSVSNQTIIIVDDGAATGASMRVAIRALRLLNAKLVVVALPVSSLEAERILKEEADAIFCLCVPKDFFAVGQWYENFEQTTDEEVRTLLTTSRVAATVAAQDC